MTIEIADRLVKLRKKYGYSQEELADKLGLSRQAVSKWERAEASPDTDNLICLAKLYGVSLDELLATDEDIDTIVDEQVKNDKKEEPEPEQKTRTKGVIIDDDGIRVQKKDGGTVVIDDDGITVTDKDGNVTKKPKVQYQKDHDKVMAVIGAIEGVLFLLVVTAYFLLGILLNMWASAWCLIFVPEIICSVARAIRKKNAQYFNVSFAACFAFFFVCMVLPDPAIGLLSTQLWNPMWVVFLAIPIYHSVVGTIHKIIGKDNDDKVINVKINNKEEDYDDDDDNDDDDDDDKD